MTGLIDLLRRHLVSDAPPLTRAERWRSTIAAITAVTSGSRAVTTAACPAVTGRSARASSSG